MKKLLIGLVVLVVIVAGGGAYLIFGGGAAQLVKTSVETAGTQVAKVDVTLADVELEILSGVAALNGLDVANPDGFETDYAFSLGGVSVKVDTGSIGSDVITINEVVVTAPKVIYELAGTDSNIATIQKNVESFTNAMGGSGGGSSSGGDAAGGEEGPKLVIENLYIRGGEVAVSAGFLDGKKMGVDLPEIHLTDIGKDSGGASGAEVAAKVLDSISSAVVTSVASLDLGSLMEGAGAVIEGAGDVVKEIGEGAGAGEAIDGATDAVGGAVEGATDAVKGLFGSD